MRSQGSIKMTSVVAVVVAGFVGVQSGDAVQAEQKAPAKAQQSVQAKGKVSAGDRKFMMEAAQGGMTEVKLGQLAERRASSNSVKQFGQRMVRDHSKANAQLKQLAARRGVSVPQDIGAEHKAVYARLSRLSGPAFDRAYMQDMVEDHVKDVSEFREQSKDAHDANVKAWAAKTLPTLQEHLRMARAINQSVSHRGTTGSGAKDNHAAHH
jgi:putative membrane protein